MVVSLVMSACAASPGPGADAGPEAEPACPALTGAEVVHQNDVTTAETWAGDGTVHHVTGGITVRPGATLTLAACAVVKVAPAQQLTVSGTTTQPAKLVSLGTAGRPVLITSAVAGQKWGGWRTLSPESTMELAYTTFENGGTGGTHGATLDLRANGQTQSQALAVLKADHLVIRGSQGAGVVLESGAAFTADSTQLTVTGGGGTDFDAIELNPIAAGTLPPLVVSGNAHDRVRIFAGSLFISADVTLKNLGVPYYFYFDRVRVTDQTGATTPTLTLEPGVEASFDDYLVVGAENPGISVHPGRLLAVGTATAPIVLTSSKPNRAAGDWPGVWLLHAPGSRLEHVRLEYAGGFNGISSANCKPVGSSDNAALFIGEKGGSYVSAASDFAAVELTWSASHGINSMWEAASFGPDLSGGFTFTSVGGCRQTRNGRPTGCGGMNDCLVP